MRVLVVGQDTGEDSAAVGALRREGHDIVRCHEPSAPSFPCVALEGGDCPIDSGPVSVAVVVGAGPTDAVGGSVEDGSSCALRRHIPLVTVGADDASPLIPWATEVLADSTDVASAVTRASLAPLAKHEAIAGEMFRATLDAHGYETVRADVRVTRTEDVVHVALQPDVVLPKTIAETASVRVLGAVTALDPHAPRVSVTVNPGGAV